MYSLRWRVKVKNIHSLEELHDIIKRDKNSERISDRRFPIRFIFLNSFEELREIIKILIKNCNVENREIVELLSDKNRWLTTDEIISWIRGISDDTIIVPLSEFLRFQDKDGFYTTLKSLTEIEKQNNIRIYIPLVGLWERFEQEFWANFYRKEEWAPIWKMESSYRKNVIYQVNFDLDSKNIPSENFAVVSTTEEWLSVWKKETAKGIVSLCKPLSYFYKNFLPDQVFDLKEIPNQKEFLEDVFGIEVLIDFRDDDAGFWDELIKEVSRCNKKGLTLKEIFSSHFNVGSAERLTPKEFLSLYFRTNKHYEKWIIKNIFLGLDEFESSYLYRCFEGLKGIRGEDLIEKLWLEIFHLPSETLTKDVFSERKELLKFLHKDFNFSTQFIEEKLGKELENIKSYPLKKKSMYLTGITFIEKKYIILDIRSVDIQKFSSYLRDIYPELAYYLDWDLIKPDNEVDNWILEYFKEYSHSKAKHVKSSRIEEIINERNGNKSTFSDWFYSMPKTEIEEDSKYVWVDGLGAEWFPLIVYLLDRYGREKKKYIKKKMLMRVNLPSTTECNEYEFEKIKDFDRYIHNQNPYKYPDDLMASSRNSTMIGGNTTHIIPSM